MAKAALVEANLRLVVSLAKKQPRARAPAGRPHSGGEHRPDARGQQVRLPPRVQVQHVRDVVDSPGDLARARRPGAHHPHAGAHGGDRQQVARVRVELEQGTGASRPTRSSRTPSGSPSRRCSSRCRSRREPVSLDAPVGDDADRDGDRLHRGHHASPRRTSRSPKSARAEADDGAPPDAHAPRAAGPSHALRLRRRHELTLARSASRSRSPASASGRSSAKRFESSACSAGSASSRARSRATPAASAASAPASKPESLPESLGGSDESPASSLGPLSGVITMPPSPHEPPVGSMGSLAKPLHTWIGSPRHGARVLRSRARVGRRRRADAERFARGRRVEAHEPRETGSRCSSRTERQLQSSGWVF